MEQQQIDDWKQTFLVENERKIRNALALEFVDRLWAEYQALKEASDSKC